MPIFCEEICTSGSGRSVMSSPDRSLWMDRAASWPCATAQMMFFGPNAASPPKNTFGLVEPMVLVSTFSMFLADRHQHVIAWNGLIRFARWNQTAPAAGVILGFYFLEGDAGELAVVM